MAHPDQDQDEEVAWRSLHVYYYDHDKDALLLDAVRPFLAEVDGYVEGGYVLRHWRQGPHLRINLRTDRRTWEDLVWPRAAAVIGAFLRERPSTTVPDPAASLERHRVLAAVEREEGPLTPWFPDNSLRQARYDSREQVLGSHAAAALAAFYQASTAPLFAMLDQVRAGNDSRTGLAVSLMLTVAALAPGGVARSFVSYRAHAEGFLESFPDPGPVRAAFDRAYRARRQALARRLHAVVTTLDDPGAAVPVPFVRAWAALLTAHGDRAASMLGRGELAVTMPPVLARPGELPEPVRRSELHRLMFTSQDYYAAVFSHPDFLRHRILLNYTYLQLTRLGLTPLDRFRACHLVANTVEEVHGTSAVDLVRRVTGR